jgi:hypothetical protein
MCFLMNFRFHDFNKSSLKVRLKQNAESEYVHSLYGKVLKGGGVCHKKQKSTISKQNNQTHPPPPKQKQKQKQKTQENDLLVLVILSQTSMIKIWDKNFHNQ